MQELADKLDAQVKVNEDLTGTISDLQTQLQNRLNEDRRSAMDDEAQNLENELQAELDAGVNNQKLLIQTACLTMTGLQLTTPERRNSNRFWMLKKDHLQI